MDWNESTIPPSPKVAEYLNKILCESSFFNLYPTTYNEKFLELLSDYIELPQENLQYFASSDALHEYICKVFISVGDPVLIYDYSAYVPKEKHRSDYIIVYSYPGRISNVNEIAAIQAFAKKKGLRLLSIGHYFPWCDDVVVPTPFEVLGWFRDAVYIVTDTFHGSVFSIKYNKKFCTIVREMNKQKLTWLLRQFGLENRIVTDLKHLENILETEIDYRSVNEKIVFEILRSKAYLRESLTLQK